MRLIVRGAVHLHLRMHRALETLDNQKIDRQEVANQALHSWLADFSQFVHQRPMRARSYKDLRRAGHPVPIRVVVRAFDRRYAEAANRKLFDDLD